VAELSKIFTKTRKLWGANFLLFDFGALWIGSIYKALKDIDNMDSVEEFFAKHEREITSCALSMQTTMYQCMSRSYGAFGTTGTTRDTENRRKVANEIADVMSTGDIPKSLMSATPGEPLSSQPFAIFLSTLLNYVPEESRDEFNLELDPTFYDSSEETINIFTQNMTWEAIEEGPMMTTCAASKARCMQYYIDYFYVWVSDHLDTLETSFGKRSDPFVNIDEMFERSMKDISKWFDNFSMFYMDEFKERMWEPKGIGPFSQEYEEVGDQSRVVYDYLTDSEMTLSRWQLPLNGESISLSRLYTQAPGGWDWSEGDLGEEFDEFLGYEGRPERDWSQTDTSNGRAALSDIMRRKNREDAIRSLILWRDLRKKEAQEKIDSGEFSLLDEYYMEESDLYISKMKVALEAIHDAVRAVNDPVADAMTMEESIRDEVGEALFTFYRAGTYAWNSTFGNIGKIPGVPNTKIVDKCGKKF